MQRTNRPRDLGPGRQTARRETAAARPGPGGAAPRSARPASRASTGTSVLLCGSRDFAMGIAAALGNTPGVTVVGYSSGNALPVGWTRDQWPDVAVVDASLGSDLARGNASPAMASAGARCGVVMVADPVDPEADQGKTIEMLRGWSLLSHDSARDPMHLTTAAQGAARGMPLIDRRIDEQMISYAAGRIS